MSADATPKIFVDDADGRPVPLRWNDTWMRSVGPAKLVIGPAGDHVGLMKDLSAGWTARHKVLYVLVVPRGEATEGRYESPWLTRADATAFLDQFREFFERDGRHEIWLAAPEEGAQVVWNRFDLLHAYGDLDQYERILQARGFVGAPVESVPEHGHYYLPEWDDAARALHAHWRWVHSPLEPRDSCRAER